MPKSIALIPARGGSKRIPQKNIKDFLGKPLLAYSIETAISSNLFSKIIVSTDDPTIANIAKEFGAEVPFLRPQKLSDDYTTTIDVINHTLQYLESNNEEFDYLCTIYATAPLMQVEYLVEGYNQLKNSDALYSFGVTEMPFPIQRTFKINQNKRCEMFWPENYNKRSQDLELAYQDAAQFYWMKNDFTYKTNNAPLFSENSIPILIPNYLVHDIDTLEDWKRVEYMYHAYTQGKFS